MAFTFAHPAAVLPLYGKDNKHIDFTGLVLGSMAPDFEYFIHFRPISIVGHTFPGQFYYNLPLVIALAYLYHNILKGAIIRNLPRPYCDRYYYLTQRKWGIHSVERFLVFCGSMIFGALTHLAWDGFTHSTGYFVQRTDWLLNTATLFGRELPIYKLLQHGTTLLGFALIAVFLWRLQEKGAAEIEGVSPGEKRRYWGGAAGFATMIFALRAIAAGSMALGEAVVSSIDGALIGLLLASMLYRSKKAME